jgi:ubiquinone biosynthesis monooxygenase Coq7
MTTSQKMNSVDNLIIEFDRVLRSMVGATPMRRPIPEPIGDPIAELTLDEKKHSAGLMRINHVGEVCAQALYQSQKLLARKDSLKEKLEHAAIEEEDHLAWCESRLKQLDSQPSLLNPVWYAGSFLLGSVAGLAGDKVSLGFVAETERQVEHHLDDHLNDLPPNDTISRAIVAQMRADEIEHGRMAIKEGGIELPQAIQSIMRMTAKAMTLTAYRI